MTNRWISEVHHQPHNTQHHTAATTQSDSDNAGLTATLPLCSDPSRLAAARKAPPSAPLTAASADASSSSFSRARFSLGSAQSPYTALPLTPDAISSVVHSLTKQQRIDLLIETKRLALTNPEAAQQLLIDHPPLAHLLLQCQLLYGLVTTDEIHALTLHPPAMHPPPPLAAPPPPVPTPLPPYPVQAPPPPHSYGAPPLAAGPSPEEILARLPPLPPQQREIVVELLKLTPEELRGLPAEAQQQVKDILQRIGIGR